MYRVRGNESGVRAGGRRGNRRAAGGGYASGGGTPERIDASADDGDPARERKEVIRNDWLIT